jgi:tetratricopeptide (TPR) repeat protein
VGKSLHASGKLEDAIAAYQKAVENNPESPEAYYHLGVAFQDRGKLNKAITSYEKSLTLNPMNALAHFNLGVALHKKNETAKAISCYKKAIDLDPPLFKAHLNLGIALKETGKTDNAIEHLKKAITIIPDSAEAYYNLGNALMVKKEIVEALWYYRKTLELEPEHALGHCNISLIHLLTGSFTEGWEEYPWCLMLEELGIIKGRNSIPGTLWDGSPVAGKTILIPAEQGFGDTIHFIRYAPLIQKLGARVIIRCQNELVTLFRSLENIEQVIPWESTLPDFDVYCPVMSLPYVFRTTSETIPAKIPYLRADHNSVQRWRNKTQGIHGLKTGLVWAGNPDYRWDHNRSCELSDFSALFLISNVAFFSLQKGNAARQARHLPAGVQLIDHTKEIHDFSDTAAFIQNLDIIISVDTAVAHLAGALGKPVWMLLPFVPDWRWMLDREDSPWYPTMRLFRQDSPGDWGPVIQRLKTMLDEYKNRREYVI